MSHTAQQHPYLTAAEAFNAAQTKREKYNAVRAMLNNGHSLYVYDHKTVPEKEIQAANMKQIGAFLENGVSPQTRATMTIVQKALTVKKLLTTSRSTDIEKIALNRLGELMNGHLDMETPTDDSIAVVAAVGSIYDDIPQRAKESNPDIVAASYIAAALRFENAQTKKDKYNAVLAMLETSQDLSDQDRYAQAQKINVFLRNYGVSGQLYSTMNIVEEMVDVKNFLTMPDRTLETNAEAMKKMSQLVSTYMHDEASADDFATLAIAMETIGDEVREEAANVTGIIISASYAAGMSLCHREDHFANANEGETNLEQAVTTMRTVFPDVIQAVSDGNLGMDYLEECAAYKYKMILAYEDEEALQAEALNDRQYGSEIVQMQHKLNNDETGERAVLRNRLISKEQVRRDDLEAMRYNIQTTTYGLESRETYHKRVQSVFEGIRKGPRQ